MKASPTLRVLLFALASTAVAACFAPPTQREVVAPLPQGRTPPTAWGIRGERPASGSREAAAIDRMAELLRTRVRDQSSDEIPDFFARAASSTASERPAPLPAEEPRVTSVIEASPPFHVVGLYQEGSRVGVFLEYRDENIVAHVGDTIAGAYKVEAIDAGILTLRHVPSNTQHSMALAGGSSL